MTFLSCAWPTGPHDPTQGLRASSYLRLEIHLSLVPLAKLPLADRQGISNALGMNAYMSGQDIYILTWLILLSHLKNKFKFCQPESHSGLLLAVIYAPLVLLPNASILRAKQTETSEFGAEKGLLQGHARKGVARAKKKKTLNSLKGFSKALLKAG